MFYQNLGISRFYQIWSLVLLTPCSHACCGGWWDGLIIITTKFILSCKATGGGSSFLWCCYLSCLWQWFRCFIVLFVPSNHKFVIYYLVVNEVLLRTPCQFCDGNDNALATRNLLQKPVLWMERLQFLTWITKSRFE